MNQSNAIHPAAAGPGMALLACVLACVHLSPCAAASRPAAARSALLVCGGHAFSGRVRLEWDEKSGDLLVHADSVDGRPARRREMPLFLMHITDTERRLAEVRAQWKKWGPLAERWWLVDNRLIDVIWRFRDSLATEAETRESLRAVVAEFPDVVDSIRWSPKTSTYLFRHTGESLFVQMNVQSRGPIKGYGLAEMEAEARSRPNWNPISLQPDLDTGGFVAILAQDNWVIGSASLRAEVEAARHGDTEPLRQHLGDLAVRQVLHPDTLRSVRR